MAEQEVNRAQLVREHAEDFSTWAEVVSGRERRRFIRFKMLQLLVGAAIPVAAAAQASNIVVAVLGAVVIVFQGADQLLQWGRRYMATAEAAEGMRREKTLWLTRAGAYGGTEDPDRLFAERVADIESRTSGQLIELTRKALEEEERRK